MNSYGIGLSFGGVHIASKMHIFFFFQLDLKAAGSNSARSQFVAMLVSCSRCSDGSIWLAFC